MCAGDPVGTAKGPEVPLRIGVHTGDIVHDQDGVYGDGVNVAARVEALAAPGGILISAKVFDEIKNHPALSAVPVGEVQLKNVRDPVSIFAISNNELHVPTREELEARAGGEGGGPSPNRSESRADDVPASLPDPIGPGEAFIHAVRKKALVQWALTYLAGAWVLIQVVGFASEELAWPSLISRSVNLLAFAGFFVALVVTWFHGERGRQRIRKSEVLLIGVLLLVAGGAFSLLTSRDGDAVGPIGTVTRAGVEGRPAVAVLPFDNFSPNSEDSYFADGVWVDITSALSRIRGLRVPGRSSADQYRESRPSSQEIARALKADYLLVGSAQIVSGAAKVTVQLIDGRTDENLWTEEYSYEFSVEQAIAIQGEIATEVASHLEAIITPEEAQQIAALPTHVPEAFILARRARHRWTMRTEADVAESVRLYQEAIELDSAYAEAYAGLADAYLVLANWGWMDHRAAYRQGITAAEKALALDPGIASAYASLGGLHLWSTKDWGQAEEAFKTAIELDPDRADSHYWYSVLLSVLGRHEESIEQAEIAEGLDPLSPPIAYGLARSLFMARDYPRSIEETKRALEIHPEYGNLRSLLCIAHIAAGSYDAAETACRRDQRAAGVSRSLNMGILKAYQGDRAGALEEVSAVLEAEDEDSLQPVIVAMVHAGLGDLDEAMAWLQRAFDEDYPHLEYLSTHPFFDPLRSDPRFLGLLRGLNLENRP